MEKFNLSDWITNDLRGDTMGIPVDAVKKFIELIKEEINSKEVWRVINGKLSKDIIDAFREGEEIGLKNKKKQDLGIINKLAGDDLI